MNTLAIAGLVIAWGVLLVWLSTYIPKVAFVLAVISFIVGTAFVATNTTSTSLKFGEYTFSFRD